MFEYEQVPPTCVLAPADSSALPGDGEAASPPGAAQVLAPRRDSAARIRELRHRIREMEPSALGTRLLPTDPAIGRLLPGGGLHQGAVYSVDRSAMLLMTLLSPASRAGTWCAAVGMPDFGAEAAAASGIDLERLVLVPRPGDHWLRVVSALADVIGLVVAKPGRAHESQISRLHARLRERGTTLLVLADWPSSEARITLSGSEWSGIGEGHGYLASREATITVTHRSAGRPRSARLRWPADLGSLPAPARSDAPVRLDLAAG